MKLSPETSWSGRIVDSDGFVRSKPEMVVRDALGKLTWQKKQNALAGRTSARELYNFDHGKSRISAHPCRCSRAHEERVYLRSLYAVHG